MAPTQVAVIPISDRHQEHARKTAKALTDLDMRVHLDERSETINYRIREAQMQQTPYMVVIGDKEVEGDAVAVRHRRQGDLGSMKLSDFVEKMKAEVEKKEYI
ncbi:MAG: Threonine--tRNA ligase [bacterium ADurb.Bin425]|nr:MAG: Threonine--tRNA ligase [bacterium ADurb.Bin425]